MKVLFYLLNFNFMQTYQTSYSSKTATKIPYKVKVLVQNRFFDQFKEIPVFLVHVIDRKDNNKKDFLILCETEKNSAIICFRENFEQVFIYDLPEII